jgi:hypothetical protein
MSQEIKYMLYHLTFGDTVAGFELAQPTFRDDAGAAKNETGSGAQAAAGSLIRLEIVFGAGARTA